MAGAACGSCLKGWDVVARGSGHAKSWQAQHFGDAIAEVVAGAAFCASDCVFAWQGQHLAAAKGLGCCRARGSGLAKSWQAQHFGDAIAEVVAGAVFCASECVFGWQGQHLAAV